MTDPAVEAAAIRFADSMSARIAEAALPAKFKAEISAISVGTARDGTNVVTVTYRSRSIVTNGYNRNYTPVVGHVVICEHLDAQIFIAYSPVGQP